LSRPNGKNPAFEVAGLADGKAGGGGGAFPVHSPNHQFRSGFHSGSNIPPGTPTLALLPLGRRRSGLICYRRTRFSPSNSAPDLRSEARTLRIVLGRSVIRPTASSPASTVHAVIIFSSARSFIQRMCIERLDRTLVSLLAEQLTIPQKEGVMPGVKYYLRQENAFLSLAQSITDTQLRARYRMMAQRYGDMASESAGEPKEEAPERRTGKERPENLR
jgi:hypothetical protein